MSKNNGFTKDENEAITRLLKSNSKQKLAEDLFCLRCAYSPNEGLKTDLRKLGCSMQEKEAELCLMYQEVRLLRELVSMRWGKYGNTK